MRCAGQTQACGETCGTTSPQEVAAILRTIMGITMAAVIAGAAHGQHLPAPVQHYANWIETATIMQPWNLERTAALVEEREEWIPRLKQWGFDTVIFVPGPGDIDPDYPIEKLRAAADHYHAAGMRVLMYWSIMHVGHHDTWHTVAQEHPEWWQRDVKDGTVTVYGDEWLCPSTGALEYTINLGIDLAKRMDADGIMLDNNEFHYTDAGATCYCEGCQEAFRAYIRGKLGDGALAALGLDPDTLLIPLPNQPLWGEWVDWRYIVWRDATEQFRRRVRAAMPGAILCANTQYKHNWVLAVQEQIEAEDLLFSESGNQLGREMACKLAYGHALADGKPVWNYLRTWKEGDLSRLGERDRVHDDLCTSLAWNTAPWIVGYGLVFQAPAQDWLQGRYQVPEGAVWLREERGGPDGSPAVRLSSPNEPARISVSHQPFPQVSPGQSFDFSIRYRTQRVREGLPRMRLTFVDAAHKVPASGQYAFYADGKGGTHGWQELMLTGVVAPEGAVLLNVEAFLWEATGSVWWDDARLTRDGEEVPLNGGFDVPAGETDARTRDALVSGLQFRREHEELYRGAVRWADVGLLLSRHSVDFAQAYNRFPRPTMHALLDAHVPFTMLEEHQLDAEHLSRVKVLIVPQASCLGDEHLAALAEWVRGGGRLIFTGATGILTPYAREREDDPLAEALGAPREELREARQVGAGMAQWLPQEDANRAVADGLMAALHGMGGGQIVRVTGGEGVDLVAWAQPEERRLLMHLDRHERGSGGEMELCVAVPEGWGRPKRVRLLELGSEERRVEFAEQGGLVTVRVPAPEWYAVLVVE